MEYIDEGLEGEAPCEFCGQLYPLVLLIEHQSIHLLNEDEYPYFDDIINPDEVQNIIAETAGVDKKSEEVIVKQNEQSAARSEPEKIVEQIQQSAVKNEASANVGNTNSEQKESPSKSKASEENIKAEQKRSSPETKPPSENITIEQKQNLLLNKTLKDIKKFPEQKGKEFITEKGEKLLVYGDEIDPDKELDNERPAYKMPDNPLLSSVCKNEDVEDINNLSDDDCDESLEEFWKKARDFLKRNRGKSEC